MNFRKLGSKFDSLGFKELKRSGALDAERIKNGLKAGCVRERFPDYVPVHKIPLKPPWLGKEWPTVAFPVGNLEERYMFILPFRNQPGIKELQKEAGRIFPKVAEKLQKKGINTDDLWWGVIVMPVYEEIKELRGQDLMLIHVWPFEDAEEPPENAALEVMLKTVEGLLKKGFRVDTALLKDEAAMRHLSEPLTNYLNMLSPQYKHLPL